MFRTYAMTLTAFFISVLSNAQDSLDDQTHADCPCGILGTNDEICSAARQGKWLHPTRPPACGNLVQTTSPPPLNKYSTASKNPLPPPKNDSTPR